MRCRAFQIAFALASLVQVEPSQAAFDFQKCFSFLVSDGSGGIPNANRYSFEAHIDREISDLRTLPFRVPEGSEVHFLGSGRLGNQVYRVRLPTGKVEVWKWYRFDFLLPGDVERFEWMRQASEVAGYQGFRVPQIYSASGQLMKMEYIAGQSVERILKGKVGGMTAEEVREVRQAYHERLESTLKALKTVHPELETKGYIGTFVDRNGKSARIHLHEDNIVVNPVSGEMSVIDPY